PPGLGIGASEAALREQNRLRDAVLLNAPGSKGHGKGGKGGKGKGGKPKGKAQPNLGVRSVIGKGVKGKTAQKGKANKSFMDSVLTAPKRKGKKKRR
ncbi:hypothetical protein KIPB_012556, partial [Kipferlia bialata]